MKLAYSLIGLLLYCLVVPSSACAASTKPLQIVTENLPPMQIAENGLAVDGMATEMVQALLQQTDMKASINVLNWARAYKIALEQENVLIYSMTRTPSREKLFKWVGSIYTLSNHLWRLKSRQDININSLDEAKYYRTVVIRQDVLHLDLVQQGFVEPLQLQIVGNLGQGVEMLYKGRVDLLAASSVFLAQYLRSSNLPHTMVIPVVAFSADVGKLYIAFSIKTDDVLVERFRQALFILKQNGIYDKIVSKWKPKIDPQTSPFAIIQSPYNLPNSG